MENTSKAREMDQMIKEQNENANLDVKEAENDNMNKEKY